MAATAPVSNALGLGSTCLLGFTRIYANRRAGADLSEPIGDQEVAE